MDISIYFSPIHFDENDYENGSLGKCINKYEINGKFPDLEEVDLAIIGVIDGRGSYENEGCENAPDCVRKSFFELFQGDNKARIVDLGNIKKGNDINDTYFALSDVVKELLIKNIIPIIIGGGQDLTYANYLAYKKIERTVNLVNIDKSFDLGLNQNKLSSLNYINSIIEDEPNYLFNCSNLAYQTYLVGQESLSLMKKLYFDYYRLGQVRASIAEIEPVLRDADIVSIDISSVRHSDAPANPYVSPNGLYGEEICQLTWYAGLSDRVSSIGFYEYNPELDVRNQTSKLIAQMIWYFVEGFYNRKYDVPKKNSSEFIKYNVTLQEDKYEIVFYKSKKSERWWMEIPYTLNKNSKFERHHLLPCTYSDYKLACNNEIPDKWWQTYQKLC